MIQIEHVREHIRLLRELEGSLVDATEGLARADLASVARETHRQREIIQAVNSIHHQPTTTPPTVLPGEANLEQKVLTGQALQDFHSIRAGVMARNRIYGALLHRSRRTVDIFARLLLKADRSDGTYAV